MAISAFHVPFCRVAVAVIHQIILGWSQLFIINVIPDDVCYNSMNRCLSGGSLFPEFLVAQRKTPALQQSATPVGLELYL